ncbi:MAG: hypothetical protein ACMXX9_02080 [Candidatus Woesearchaeota archaeon]
MKPKEFEDLDDEKLIQEFESKQKNNKYKKYYIILIALFSVLLMASYIYLSFPVYGIIAGQIESQKINENVISTRDIKIIFENQTNQIVFDAYHDNPDVETSLCLEGYRQNNNYYITYAYMPVIYSQSYTHVSHAPCSNETIAMFHTHPYKSCIASRQDIQTLRQNQDKNPDIIMIIMCEPQRFSVYR